MNIVIDGLHDIDNKDIEKYVLKKVGNLVRFMPRHARLSASAHVKLKEEKVKDKKNCWCEIDITLPGEVLSAKESTINMFAAVDIVYEKSKSQLKRYKDKHTSFKKNPIRKILQRIRPSQD
jgi:putative sigma-54 modulation protein